MTEIAELTSTQEEEDTTMMINVKHAASKYSKVVLVLEDTDVFVNLLGLYSDITAAKLARIFLRRGKRNKIRLIDIS